MLPTILSESTTITAGTLFQGITAQQIFEQIFSAAPVLMPVVIGCLAFRKGIGWGMRMLRRA
jgi:hypothetical protein